MKEETDEIKEFLKTKKIVIGTNNVLKNLRKNNLKTVFLSSNCPKKVNADVVHYSSLLKIEVVQLKVSNEELGVLCKKPFSVSILGIIK